MLAITRLNRASASVCLIFISWILPSCTDQILPELALRQVLLTEWPAHAYSDERPVLLVELVQSEQFHNYPDAPYIRSGFCGEKLNVGRVGSGRLFIESPSGGGPSKGRRLGEPRPSTSTPLFAVINLTRPQGLGDRPDIFPDYDLKNEDRDICLGTVVPGMLSGKVSNTVRIPRDVIVKALREGVKPLPALVPFVETFPVPKMSVVGSPQKP